MKVTGYYYYDYLDSCPIDPTNAVTKMEVIVQRDEDDETSNYRNTYAFIVYTFKYLR